MGMYADVAGNSSMKLSGALAQAVSSLGLWDGGPSFTLNHNDLYEVIAEMAQIIDNRRLIEPDGTINPNGHISDLLKLRTMIAWYTNKNGEDSVTFA